MQDQPNVKLCECGCGRPAPIAARTYTRLGVRKGEPHRFIVGHVGRAFSPATRRKLSDAQRARTLSAETRGRISDALRGRTLSPETKLAIGVAVKARPSKPLTAEHRRNMSIAHGGTGELSYGAIHSQLSREHPKAGVCEECGKTGGRTEYAFQRHPEPHTTERDDYRELCPRCHKHCDAWLWA